MTDLRLTLQASPVKDQGWQTQQALGLSGNGPKRLSEGLSTPNNQNLEDLSSTVARGMTPSLQSVCDKKLPHWSVPANTKSAQGREAIRIYDKMREDGVGPSICMVVAALKACTSLRDVQTGMKIHADVTKSGDDSNIFVANTLVDLYAKYGNMVDAQRVFDRIPHQSVVSWNTIILGYAQNGEGELALLLFAQMQDKGFTPNARTFIAALKSCTSLALKEDGKKVEGALVKIVCLEKGMAIHSQVERSGHELDIFVGSTLMDMYVKCGSLVDACRVFDMMPYHDVVAWNAIIQGYAQSGEGECALQLFAQMQDEGFTPDARTFVAALNACTSLAANEVAKHVQDGLVKIVSLEKGRAIHSQFTTSRHCSDIFVANTLVDMYSKCGSMVDARRVFDRMPHHDVVSWTAIILGYAQNEEGDLALKLFAQMRDEGCAPNARTFVAAMQACASLAAKEDVKIVCLEKGIAIHSEAAKSGYEIDIFVASTLVDMYSKCGSMVDAQRVFDMMPHHDVVSWNAIILGYAQGGEGELALQLFAQMQDEGFTPDARTFVAALNACTNLAVKEEGRRIQGAVVKVVCLEKGIALHYQVAKSGLDSDIFVANTLVDMYAKCGSMVDARRVFDRMPHHDVVSWTAIILGYAQNDEGELALKLFAQMHDESSAPYALTFVAALKACSSLAAKEEGKLVEGKLVKILSLEKGIAIHAEVATSGHELDVFVASTLVDMYAKCGSMVNARRVFDMMPLHGMVSWNAIILGYAQSGDGELALQLFARMQDEGFTPDARTFVAALKASTSLAETGEKHGEAKLVKLDGNQVQGGPMKVGCLEKGIAIHSQLAKTGFDSDIFVASTLVDMYSKCGSMVDAQCVFDRMPQHDVVSWNAIMLGYVQSGEGELALQLYARMHEEGFRPDARTFVAALKACGSVVALETGKQIHAEICSTGLQSDVVVANCLIDLYGKCGSMVDAQQVFDSFPTRNLVTWSALIAGYSRQGDTKHVFDLFERMQKERLQADGITFLSILSACSHVGLVDKGKEFFEAMCSNYGINPGIEHYTCMVDLLGRANHLDEAVAMVKNMPFEPTSMIWMTVLGACQKWRNVAVGKLAFESLLRLDDRNASAYVLMANIYAGAGMWEESARIHAMRKNAGAWKKPGQSWTDTAGIEEP